MKRIIPIVLCLVLLLGACAPTVQPSNLPDVQIEKKPALPPQEEPEEPDYDDIEEDFGAPGLYVPDGPLELQETVNAYFEQQYLAYINLQHIDISELLVMDSNDPGNHNLLVWLQLLAQRRRLIDEYDFCYVEREMYDFDIAYIDEEDLDDQRMELWDNGVFIGPDEVVLHFVVEGEPGVAYPPTFAPNSQHTMRLQPQEDGGWKIAFHYFPGSVRKFYRNHDLALRPDEEVLEALYDEFLQLDEPAAPDVAGWATPYDGQLAAAYAWEYTEQSNSSFYDIGDWIGDCANFVSQCIWFGFSDGVLPATRNSVHMTGDWYASEGGGSPAWETVEIFWNYITGGGALTGQVLESADQLRVGDVVQTRSGGSWRDPDDDVSRYNHCLLVVDEETLLLAQNSPNCFVYYSDLVEVDRRFVRPVSVS